MIESGLVDNRDLFRNQNDVLDFRGFRAPMAEEVEKLQNLDSIDGHCLF